MCTCSVYINFTVISPIGFSCLLVPLRVRDGVENSIFLVIDYGGKIYSYLHTTYVVQIQ